jgi:hypothetical protein
MILLPGENRRARSKPYSSVPLFNTNFTSTDPNPDLRDEKPATNRLSYDTN